AASSGLVQLDRVPVGIFDQNLAAAGAALHLIAERYGGPRERVDLGTEVIHVEHDPVPTTWLLPATVRHGARARRPGPAQYQPEAPERDHRKHRPRLLHQPEAELLSVEGDGFLDIADLIADHGRLDGSLWGDSRRR